MKTLHTEAGKNFFADKMLKMMEAPKQEGPKKSMLSSLVSKI